jgi:hypothetical protein
VKTCITRGFPDRTLDRPDLQTEIKSETDVAPRQGRWHISGAASEADRRATSEQDTMVIVYSATKGLSAMSASESATCWRIRLACTCSTSPSIAVSDGQAIEIGGDWREHSTRELNAIV